jgi:hypothetical protein
MRGRFRKKLRERWKIFRQVPEARTSIFFVPDYVVWLYSWLRKNREITRFLSSKQLGHLVVTYRDLARDPGTEVRRVMEWAGLTYEPGQLEYWNFDHVGTEKKAYEWVKEQKTTYFDLRWQTELPAPAQEAARRNPPTARYLASLGLRMVDDGLTRLP